MTDHFEPLTGFKRLYHSSSDQVTIGDRSDRWMVLTGGIYDRGELMMVAVSLSR